MVIKYLLGILYCTGIGDNLPNSAKMEVTHFRHPKPQSHL